MALFCNYWFAVICRKFNDNDLDLIRKFHIISQTYTSSDQVLTTVHHYGPPWRTKCKNNDCLSNFQRVLNVEHELYNV